MEWLDWATSHNKEGVMINIANAPYICDRNSGLLKVKRFKECEGVVREVLEGNGRHQGRLGSVIVEIKDKEGRFHTVKVGSGFSDDQRALYWKAPAHLIGKVVDIGYFEVTKNKGDDSLSLRFPTWLDRIRYEKNEEDMNCV